jgi:hypothetical protein
MEFKVHKIYNHKDSVSQGTLLFTSTQSPVPARQRRSKKTYLATYTTCLLKISFIRVDFCILTIKKKTARLTLPQEATERTKQGETKKHTAI